MCVPAGWGPGLVLGGGLLRWLSCGTWSQPPCQVQGMGARGQALYMCIDTTHAQRTTYHAQRCMLSGVGPARVQ